VLSQLAEVCGTLSQDDEDRVYGLPSAALEKLAKALLRFQSLDDLHDWLERHAVADA
jgi:DNA-binding IclR family transcriptional regulator